MPELRVSVVSIPVSDQDRARSFYRDVLGFEEVADTPYGDGLRWVQVRPPGSPTSFTLVTWFPSMPPGSVSGYHYEPLNARSKQGIPFGRRPACQARVMLPRASQLSHSPARSSQVGQARRPAATAGHLTCGVSVRSAITPAIASNEAVSPSLNSHRAAT